MANNQPKEYDAVLGGQLQVNSYDAVLGGVEKLKKCLLTEPIESKLAALRDAHNYGDAGLDLIIEALQFELPQVKKLAYILLRQHPDLKAKQLIEKCNQYQFFQYLDASELLQLYGVGEREFSGFNLSGAYLTIDPNGSYGDITGHDLQGINLSGANLYNARLTACNLSYANLSGADLRADLTLVNFTGANLSGADLSDAYMNEAILRSANLTRAKLSNTEMSGADLTDANLLDATYFNTGLMEGVIWCRTTLPNGHVIVEKIVGFSR